MGTVTIIYCLNSMAQLNGRLIRYESDGRNRVHYDDDVDINLNQLMVLEGFEHCYPIRWSQKVSV
ncbi:MAG: hypothetical protein L0H53_17240 [Candidatus Nitrosocosmicus sp.]|nr:hypothetical protein [Candidatus Nitrosocosmicus sp.]MDN5866881.1 hypothetical protein [Candidatus Nitrosocosmicus sp.]